MSKESTQQENQLTFLYCGGCGHRFFNSPQVTEEEAVTRAEELRCHYCIEEGNTR